MATGALAGLLRWLSPAGAAGLALALVAHNVVVMPRWGGALHRGRVDPGILSYPVAVLGLVLVFRSRPELAAAAWGLLAFGDGAANLAGRHLGGPRIPWNRAKRIVGALAFVGVGTPAAAALLAFVSAGGAPGPAVPFGEALAPVGLAALAAALAESVRSTVDDNLRVAASAAAVLALAFGAVPALSPDGLATAAARASIVLPVSVVLAAAAVALRVATVGGAAAGAGLLAVTAMAGGGGPGLAFAAFVVVGSAATRIGRARKRALGLEEPGGGRRSAVHAIANGGLAAALTLAALLADRPEWCLGAVAALATAAFDTVATEIGPLVQGRPCRLATLERVPAGTPGAVSLAGTLAGGVAAAVVAAAALFGPVAAGWVGLGRLPLGAGAAMAGIVVAAVLAGTLESLLSGAGAPLGHHARNALNTAVGAGIALALAEV